MTRRRSPVLRRATGAVLAAALVAVAPTAGAGAAERITPNACFYGIDGFWRSLDLRLAGTAQPQYVPPGSGLRLTGTAASATLPGWIAEFGFNLGHLDAGLNRVPARVWVAVAGRGSTRGAEVVRAETVAETTITADATGQRFVSATPLTVTVPLPDTTWGAPAAGTDRVSFEQAPAGSLPAIPAESGAAAVTPRGSIFIRARLTNSTIFDVDCQPGRGGATGETFATGAATPFELAWLDPDAPPTGIAPPPAAAPEAAIVSTVLRASQGRTRVRLRLRNPGAVATTGQVRIRTVARQRLGTRRAIVTALPWTSYTLPASGTRTVTLPLGTTIARVLRDKDEVSVSVSLRTGTASTPGRVRSTRMTLHAR